MDVINGDPKCASVQNQLQEKMHLKLGRVGKNGQREKAD